jgi:hypothetical protein
MTNTVEATMTPQKIPFFTFVFISFFASFVT